MLKLVKFEENSQYGYDMTKPLATDYFKQEKPTLKDFNMSLETVSLEDKTGHLIVVDIGLEARKLIYDELYTPIFKKQKILDSSEKSVFQLSENIRMGKIFEMLPFKGTKKVTPLCSKKFSFGFTSSA